jgi:hypothetical protein
VNGKEQKFVHGNDDLIRINFLTVPAQRIKVKINYGGKPVLPKRRRGQEGFNGRKIQKKSMISITCQGEGAKIFFPCKDHPA